MHYLYSILPVVWLWHLQGMWESQVRFPALPEELNPHLGRVPQLLLLSTLCWVGLYLLG